MMPVSRRKKTVPKKPIQVCISCGKTSGFYKSKQTLHKYYETLPICKDCIIDIYDEAYKRFQNLDRAIIDVCKRVNIPFLRVVFDNAKEEMENQNLDMSSAYFKHYSITRTKKDLVFADSDMFKNPDEKLTYIKELDSEEKTEEPKEPVVIDPELVKIFGEGFSEREYKAMKNKYELMMDNYHAPTYMHIEALVTFIKYRTKEEFAIAEGDIDSAKKWADLAKNAATAAKINPSQFSKADLQGGVNTFSEVAKLIEQTEDIIKILPQFRMEPMDVPDFIIWCYTNYARELKGLPKCSYQDVYSFYDKMLEEYIEQNGDPYGLFTEARISEDMRKNISKFISDIEDFDGNAIEDTDEGADEDG